MIWCACNGVCIGVSNSSGLNGDGVAGVAVGDAGGRCCTCIIGFNIMSSQECFTV